jgi:hypothetical protein
LMRPRFLTPAVSMSVYGLPLHSNSI